MINTYNSNKKYEISYFFKALANSVYAQNGIDKIQVISGSNAIINNSNGFILGSFTYNNQHEPLISKNASAQTTTFTYNVFGEPISVTAVNGNTSTAIYTGTALATIGGIITPSDILTITVQDASLSGGQLPIAYTVQVSDTLTSIATGITNAINTSSALSAISITGSNNTNVTFTGQNFNTSLPITSGATSVNITGLDAANNQVSNNTQILSIGRSNANTSFDLNGNMINDGTNTYQYDAEDRLVQINYPGTGNNTQIFYDGLGHWVKAIETINNATTSVIQYLWNGNNLIEERDGSGNVLRRFFNLGEQINGTNYYYVKDHLGSIRQMTDNSGNIVYQADYDAYGRATVTINTVTPAFGYAGYYVHNRSGLNLTVHRAYSPTFGRWLNRDPIGEAGGINLYGYVDGDPVDAIDPLGLQLLKGGISIDVPYPTPSPLSPGGGKCTGSSGGNGGGGSGGSGGGGGTGIGGLPTIGGDPLLSGISNIMSGLGSFPGVLMFGLPPVFRFAKVGRAIPMLPNASPVTLKAAELGQEAAQSAIKSGNLILQPIKPGYYANSLGSGWAKFQTPSYPITGTIYTQSVHGFINVETGETQFVKMIFRLPAGF